MINSIVDRYFNDEVYTAADMANLFKAIHEGKIKTVVVENVGRRLAFDVATVVRCKDCRYWQDKWEQDKFSEENHTTMPCIEMATADDFYCGFAKEKDGDNK